MRITQRDRLFVIQHLQASQLHYDSRLDIDGTLKAWPIPTGPSPNPSLKRHAVTVEEHPFDYAKFEAVIREGDYAVSTGMIWDSGTHIPEETDGVSGSLQEKEFRFTLSSIKLKDPWVLARFRNRARLLIKHSDSNASLRDTTRVEPRSVLSGRRLPEIAANGGGNINGGAPSATATSLQGAK